ncbi:MAG: hypothetical protein IJN82_01845 [Clostridia bacterium]|nr:hypothetical protein [Clostridia bacterium]
MIATDKDIQFLEALYHNRKPYHGELHDHAATAGTSDGKCSLSFWREDMKRLKMDFAAILDHKQVRHMYQPEWEDGLFIGGTEPGGTLTDIEAELPKFHYNMLVEGPAPLEELLSEFPEYHFLGGKEGHFCYPKFTLERLNELITALKAKGGFFVHPHPKQKMISDNPMDYFFQEETGIEVFYNDNQSEYTSQNYKLWLALLAAGKRIWACAGGDYHHGPNTSALTTIYAEEKSNKAYLSHLREGDFVCGPVGIRMAIGDTKMGGKCSFENKRLRFSVGDFHPHHIREGHEFRVYLYDDQGFITSRVIDPNTTNYFAIDTKPCKFYRLEVHDYSQKVRVAIGNPIWNID